jgi:hypothetical protein
MTRADHTMRCRSVVRVREGVTFFGLSGITAAACIYLCG